MCVHRSEREKGFRCLKFFFKKKRKHRHIKTNTMKYAASSCLSWKLAPKTSFTSLRREFVRHKCYCCTVLPTTTYPSTYTSLPAFSAWKIICTCCRAAVVSPTLIKNGNNEVEYTHAHAHAKQTSAAQRESTFEEQQLNTAC